MRGDELLGFRQAALQDKVIDFLLADRFFVCHHFFVDKLKLFGLIMDSLQKKTLFWDVDMRKLSVEKDWYFIIERIFEFGDMNDYLWLQSAFSREQINTVVKSSRILSVKTRSFCRVAGYEN